MVSSEDVINIYQLLTADGIQVWILGGWGIDVLLNEQTRPHKDLDLIVLLNDVARMTALLVSHGYELKEIWSENKWAVDGSGVQVLTAFVLQVAGGCELDFHAMQLDSLGNGIPAWETEIGFTFTREDLGGVGIIHGKAVHCITAEKQMLCHTGYVLPEKQIPDMSLLHHKFGVDYPAGFTLASNLEN